MIIINTMHVHNRFTKKKKSKYMLVNLYTKMGKFGGQNDILLLLTLWFGIFISSGVCSILSKVNIMNNSK